MEIYLVGGAVRDKLLDYPSHDRDWVVVGARPEELLNLGYQQVGKDFPVFLHPNTKEEYALARRERKQGSGYHGFICDFGPDISLEDDLSRRDLRINAMAMDEQGRIIDPYGGQQDLQDKVLRHISIAFSEDPLRVIRVARYAARYAHLGFTIAPDTLALMSSMSTNGELGTLAAERLWTEFSRALAERTPSVFLAALQHCGALAALFPKWSEVIDTPLLAALDRAADAGLKLDIRFAMACSALEKTDCADLCNTLRSSKSAAQLAQCYAAFTPLPELESASQYLIALETFDYLRRPELLDDFCAGAVHLGAESTLLGKLQQAAAVAAKVQAAELVAEGLSGPALGKALRERRLQAVENLLSSLSDRER